MRQEEPDDLRRDFLVWGLSALWGKREQELQENYWRAVDEGGGRAGAMEGVKGRRWAGI